MMATLTPRTTGVLTDTLVKAPGMVLKYPLVLEGVEGGRHGSSPAEVIPLFHVAAAMVGS